MATTRREILQGFISIQKAECNRLYAKMQVAYQYNEEQAHAYERQIDGLWPSLLCAIEALEYIDRKAVA